MFIVKIYPSYHNVLAIAKYKYTPAKGLLMKTAKIGASAGGLLGWSSTNRIRLEAVFSVPGSADPGGE